MQTRAARCGGSLDIEAKPGQVTIIRARLPLLTPAEAGAA